MHTPSFDSSDLLSRILTDLPTKALSHIDAGQRSIMHGQHSASSLLRHGLEQESNQFSWLETDQRDGDDEQRYQRDDRIPASRYRLGQELGRGGMGVVYAGWDIQLQRSVAIKIISAEYSQEPSRLLRFLREARIASRLHHPGIIVVHEFDVTEDGVAYIVMRLLNGFTLQSELKDRSDPAHNLPRFLSIFQQICQAMAYAHSLNIVHRDLKPSNIMVGRFGEVTVMDWGLAKQLPLAQLHAASQPASITPAKAELSLPATPSLIDGMCVNTLFGTQIGTPGYLSPEQARGDVDRIDKRSDVFELGSILCEILTGEPPFVATTALQSWKKSVNGELSEAMERLDICGGPLAVVHLAKRCLNADPQLRPEDANQLAEEITQYLQSGQQRAEQELVQFFDLSLDLFCIANLSGYFYRLNDNFPRLLGHSMEYLKSQRFIEFVHPDDQASTLAEIEKLRQGKPTIEFVNRYRHANGQYVWLEWTARSVVEESAVYAVARNITDRVLAARVQQRLENEKQQLTEIIDLTEDALVNVDRKGIINGWNRAAEHLFGYSQAETLGRSISFLMPPDRIHEHEVILKLLTEGWRVDHLETICIAKDGRHLDIKATVSVIRNSHGEVVGASTLALDISDQKCLQNALDKSRRALVDLAENANVPMHWININGVILWANQAELDLLGYTRAEYIGYSLEKFCADQSELDRLLNCISRNEQLAGYRVKLIAKDGTHKCVSIYSSNYLDQGQLVHARCFAFDVSP